MMFMGIGMVFFGLELMKNGFKPLREMPEFIAWFSKFSPVGYWGIIKCTLVGAGVTAIVQSSSATVGITMGLASQGIIDFETAVALVLGQNIGTTITAYLACIGTVKSAKRVAYAHILIKVIGVVVLIILFPWYVALIKGMLVGDPNASVLVNGETTYPTIIKGIAVAHTTFNVILVAAFLPFTKKMANLLTKLMPDSAADETPHLTYLDVRMLNTPALGLEQSRQELLFMAESVHTMMNLLRDSLFADKADQEAHRRIFRREDILDNVQKEITEFLGSLLSGNVTHEIIDEARGQVRLADEYESVSDYIADILKMQIKLRSNKLMPSKEGQQEMLELHDRTTDYLKFICVSLCERTNIQNDAVMRSDELTRMMKDFRGRHLERLASGETSPLLSLVVPDMLIAYRRINDHALNIAEVIAGEK